MSDYQKILYRTDSNNGPEPDRCEAANRNLFTGGECGDINIRLCHTILGRYALSYNTSSIKPRESLKLRDVGLKKSDGSEIWQTARQ